MQADGPFSQGRSSTVAKYLAEVEATLPRLSPKPALILWEDQDRGFKLPRERFERLFPSHHTRILHGAKHFVPEEAPEQICEEVISFFAGIAIAKRDSCGDRIRTTSRPGSRIAPAFRSCARENPVRSQARSLVPLDLVVCGRLQLPLSSMKR
jgi:hypothetical protein